MKSYFPRALLTGAGGQLGLAIKHHPLATRYTLLPYTHAEMDITNPDDVKKIFLHTRPDMVINAAAYTSVDNAEKEKKEAMLANYQGAQNIAIACQAAQIPLLHLSTNYVFDGRKTSGYTEEDTPAPINVYGESKYLGEEAIRTHCEQYIILRVSSLFGEYGKNFFKMILMLSKQRKELNLIADQISCPTYTGHIAETLLKIAMQPQYFGTYHYCNQHPISWYLFATAVLEEIAIYTPITLKRVNPIASVHYHSSTMRPLYSALNNTKILKTYPVKEYAWRDALRQIIQPMIREIT